MNRTQRRAEQRRAAKLARKAGQPRPASSLGAGQSQNHATPETETVASPVSHASAAQIAANRENAKHSTGPQSDAGKATVSQNRRVHGLNYNAATFAVLPCEDQSDYDRLLQSLTADHKPETATESLLVVSMAQHRWLLDRATRLQETCLNPATGQIADQKLFSLYLRYATTHERAFHKCLNDLLRLRKEEQTRQFGFESQKRQAERHENRINLEALEQELKRIELHRDVNDLKQKQAPSKGAETIQTAA